MAVSYGIVPSVICFQKIYHMLLSDNSYWFHGILLKITIHKDLQIKTYQYPNILFLSNITETGPHETHIR